MKTIKITEEVHQLLLKEKAEQNFKTISETIKYWWAKSEWLHEREIKYDQSKK